MILVCLCVLSSLALRLFFRICRGRGRFLRLLLGLMRCGRFCMGCFVFSRQGLVGCGLLQIGRRRRLVVRCFCFWLLVLFVLILVGFCLLVQRLVF